ncbi:hypothetical protein OH775_46580 [Streptomyces sp. NBC_01615]
MGEDGLGEQERGQQVEVRGPADGIEWFGLRALGREHGPRGVDEDLRRPQALDHRRYDGADPVEVGEVAGDGDAVDPFGEFGVHDYLEIKGVLGYAPDEAASSA